MKRISPYWSLLVGLLTIVYQVVLFYIRFHNWNSDSPFLDYVFFFLAGTLGGLILISFLNRQSSIPKRWIVLSSFVMSTPVAMIFILGGGLLGGLGIILFPQIPWTLMTWIGTLAAKIVK